MEVHFMKNERKESENSLFEKYENQYKLSKTARFAAVPIGKTEEHLKQDWNKLRDQERFENYPEAKKIADELIKRYISEKLTQISENRLVDFSTLAEAYEYEKDKTDSKKAYQNQQKIVRKKIAEFLPKKEWTQLLGKQMFNKNGYYTKQNLSKDDTSIMSTFDGFAMYFNKYSESKENLFSADEKSTAIAYRIVNDNFPKYMKNADILKMLKAECEEVFNNVRSIYPDIEDYIDGKNYICVIEQSQINKYNEVIGETNKQMNLFQQQVKNDDSVASKLKKRKNTKLITLYNQIMGYVDKKAFVDSFDNDNEVYNAINIFMEEFNDNIVCCFNRILEAREYFDYNKIYIKDIETLSVFLNSKWDYIRNALWNYTEYSYSHSKKKITAEKIEKEIKDKVYTINELNEALEYYKNNYKKDDDNSEKIIQDICIEKIFDVIEEKLEDTKVQEANCRTFISADNKLPLQEADVSSIKDYLDSILQLFRIVRLFDNGDYNDKGDNSLYAEVFMLKEHDREFMSLYNKVRNYVTVKPGDVKKMRLMFDYPDFCHGFSYTKINDYASFMLRKNGKYYLGVLNKNKKNKIKTISDKNDNYELLNYYQFDATTQIPRCAIIKEARKHFEDNDSDYLITKKEFSKPFTVTKKDFDLYTAKKYKREYFNSTDDYDGYKAALNQWMEFCIRFLKSYDSTKDFDLSEVMPLSKYEYLSDFYNDLDKILYSIDFKPISSKYIDDMVENNEIYLFKIYNKDFSDKSKGAKNLHTLYWRQIFSEENKQSRVFQLNGGAELFYRPKSIEKPVVHKCGSILLNKYYVEDGQKKPLPEHVYDDWYKYLNKIGNVELTEEDMQYEDKISYSEALHDIIKDKRYTKEQYEFHVSFKINYSAIGNKYINSDVLKTIQESDNVNIIGIDRGERNLLAYSVINSKGKILKQGTFNTVSRDNVNYKAKLQMKESERNEARKNWKSIGKIKDLKEGYLSQVIYELTQLMLEYNAIIVMENLNYGFKRGRMKVERQVYQKFEKALIDKLNYLVTTKDETLINEKGGVLRGYQLTQKFESFSKMGNQNGFLFYVPAGYTSKIDPITGFADVFNYSKLTNATNIKEFFGCFEDISYDEDKKLFKFSFDYKDFSTFQEMSRTKWDVYTYGEKYKWNNESRKNELVCINDEMFKCLKENAIESYENLYKEIMEIDSKNASFWWALLRIFKLTTQMRSSSTDTLEGDSEDKIISPVVNENGGFFETNGDYDSDVPADADTNGAYHIALKGAMLIQQIYGLSADKTGKLILSNDNDKIDLSNKNWFKFVQDK